MPCYEDIVDTPEGGIDSTDEDPSPPSSGASVYDAEVTDKVSGGQSLKFKVGIYPINFVSSVQVNYATSNGSAVAGTHYQSTSGTLSIPAGESEGEIEVNVIGNFSNTAPRQFTITLSVPVNCVLDDSVATGTIRYETVINNGGGDPLDRNSYQSIRRADRKVQDQYATCATRNQCTAYAMASWMSVVEMQKTGLKRGFDAPNAFSGSGGTPCSGSNCSCTTWYDSKVFAYTRATGIRRLNADGSASSLRRKIGPVSEITSRPWTGSAQAKKRDYIRAIKSAIYNQGAVYLTGVWYSIWNSATVNKRDPVMDPKSGWPSSSTGHAMALVGWDNDRGGGSFIAQNSLGTRWGDGGWGYFRFSFLYDSYNGSKFRRTSSMGYPWFRVFKLTYAG